MEFSTTLGHILVVDDDEMVREYLLTRLEEAGYSCSGVANGIEAIQALSRGPKPEVILLDLNMPGMDGMEFLRLANEHIGSEFGVIVMSGLQGSRLKQQVMRYGAFTLLEKPVDFDKLLRMIRIQQEFRRTRNNLR